MELSQLASVSDMNIKDLINHRSQVFKKLDPDFDGMDEETAADLIKAYPRLLKRPILTDGSKLFIIGFKETEYKKLL